MEKDYLKGRKANFDKYPSVQIEGTVFKGWETIISKVSMHKTHLVAIECYQGCYVEEVEKAFATHFEVVNTSSLFKSSEEVMKMTQPDVTDDAIFGFMTRLKMEDFFDSKKLSEKKEWIKQQNRSVVVIGPGSFLIAPEAGLKIYADMARWEIQLRMRQHKVKGLGVDNEMDPFNIQYKRGFFVDWRVCDEFKKIWFKQCDYLLDTNKPNEPKLVEMTTILDGLKRTATRPFRVVPFFDPGPWGGHWMESICDLDTTNKLNHAWCFDCVPEENSLCLNISGEKVEIPSIDVVFFESKKLLGDPVEARFGAEFPIRFDFLDTMGGGNLSLQVHPDTTFIQKNFGLNYTQDESYYLLAAEEDAHVFLGVKTDVDKEKMISDLKEAQKGEKMFDAEPYINKFPAKAHDHFLIPAGTMHCSGANSMVLEISATPYIFTFKVWDWGRLGLDGLPRPINIERASHVINWERNTEFAKKELVNAVHPVAEGDGWREEHTGLHKREFIETRRHFFTKKVTHYSNDSVCVFNLVQGNEAIVESPNNEFEPFIVHYAETFIVPASIKEYTISPYGSSIGQELITIKAFIRTNP